MGIPRLMLAAASHPGRRGHQEDAYFTGRGKGLVAAVVADGMGGHAAGEVASGLAVAAVQRRLNGGVPNPDPVVLLRSAAEVANREILKHAEDHPESEGLGTTFVGVVLTGTRAVIGHAGDSRAWLVTPQEVVQLTRDHSVVQDALDRGSMEPGDVERSPYRHAILRSLGDAEFPGLELDEMEVPEGSILLLTTDGAHGFLSEAEILEQLAGTASLHQGLDHLLRLAYHNGSDDNITLVACEVGSFARSAVAAQAPPPLPASGNVHPDRASHLPILALLGLTVAVGMVLAAMLVHRLRGREPVPVEVAKPLPSRTGAPPLAGEPAPVKSENADAEQEQLRWASPIPAPTKRVRPQARRISHGKGLAGSRQAPDDTGSASVQREVPEAGAHRRNEGAASEAGAPGSSRAPRPVPREDAGGGRPVVDMALSEGSPSMLAVSTPDTPRPTRGSEGPDAGTSGDSPGRAGEKVSGRTLAPTPTALPSPEPAASPTENSKPGRTGHSQGRRQ